MRKINNSEYTDIRVAGLERDAFVEKFRENKSAKHVYVGNQSFMDKRGAVDTIGFRK